MPAIPIQEVQFARLSLVDDVGRVFTRDGRILRAIRSTATERTLTLLGSEFFRELVARRLFPETCVTDFSVDGFPLVLEHRALPWVSFPHEWSFEMFRDAALLVLELAEIAQRHGWSLKDCHPYNVLFDGVRPVYVDLGSFNPAEAGADFERGADFLSQYWRPLSLWAEGDEFLAQRIIASGHETLPDLSWRLRQSPFLRWIGPERASRIIRLWNRFGQRCARKLRARNGAARPASRWAKSLPMDFLSRNPALLRQKLASLRAPHPASAWHGYHDEYFASGSPSATPRFARIVEHVRALGCQSVVELAGNRGLLGLLLLEKTPVERIVCTDYDRHAIDELYRHVRSRPLDGPRKLLLPAVVNLMIPEVNVYTPLPAERFRADLVTALAVTHHLTLSQGFPIDEVMRMIASFTRRYAMVEFMPLGLWDGRTAPPSPDWYRLEWFQRAFQEHFELLHVEELEKNRVLHIGQIRGVPAP